MDRIYSREARFMGMTTDIVPTTGQPNRGLAGKFNRLLKCKVQSSVVPYQLRRRLLLL
jgi:hypothetical protein